MTCIVLKSTFWWSTWPETHCITWLNILRSFPLCCEITLKQWTWNATSGGSRKLLRRQEHFSISMSLTPTTGEQSELSLHWAYSASSETALRKFDWEKLLGVEDNWLMDGIAYRVSIDWIRDARILQLAEEQSTLAGGWYDHTSSDAAFGKIARKQTLTAHSSSRGADYWIQQVQIWQDFNKQTER